MGLRPERQGLPVTTEGGPVTPEPRRNSEFVLLRELFPTQELAPSGRPNPTSSPPLGPAQLSSQLSEEGLRWVINPSGDHSEAV